MEHGSASDQTLKNALEFYRKETTFARLYEALSYHKRCITSLCALEKFSADGHDVMVEHQEILVTVPYGDDAINSIFDQVMAAKPEYDTVVWRIIPEVCFFKIDNDPDRFSEYRYLRDGETPDVVRLYMRLSLVSGRHQVRWKDTGIVRTRP